MDINKISIVIVSWNSSVYLFECLNSLRNNIIDLETEIIVVDNASSDDTVDMVRSKYPEVNLIINNANLGFSKANNIGIAHSRGEFVCFINSDVKLLNNCIRYMFLFLSNNKNVGMIGPKILYPNYEIQRSCMGFPTLWNQFCCALKLDVIMPCKNIFGGFEFKYLGKTNDINEVDVINGCFWMVRREAIEQVGTLDERFYIYGEDIDWCKRFHKAGWKVIYYPHASAIHYGGGSSKNAPVRFYVEMQKANFQYWKKYHSRFQQVMYLVIKTIHETIRILLNSVRYLLKSKYRDDLRYKLNRSVAGIKWIFSSRGIID